MISIAMTTYNGERYLQEQIDSILNQTYSNFELIICDDCSTDSTIEIISSYNDSRIKLFVNDKNLGFKKNFEKAIKLCTGEYIALSDQDDIWKSNHLEVLYEKINNKELICGNNLLINENGESKNINFFDSNLLDTNFYNTNYKIFLKILFSGGCFQGASMLMKKDFALKQLPIPDNINSHDFWLSTNALLNNNFVCTNEIVTKYRQHSFQVTKQNLISTSRISLINELNKKNVNSDFAIFLFYFNNSNSFFLRIRTLKYWYKYYYYIYPDRKIKKIFIRFIKYLLGGKNEKI